jgi:predicted nucleotide-binding protein
MALPRSRTFQDVLDAAESYSRENRHSEVSTADLLLALASIGPSLAAEALALENVTGDGIRRRIGARTNAFFVVRDAEDARAALESADVEARSTNSAEVEPEHLLASLMKINTEPNEASRIVHELGSTTSRVRERVQRLAQQRPVLQSKRVFVVYGRDGEAEGAMFDFLRALSLEPLGWEKIVELSQEMSPHLSRALARSLDNARATVVLMTPDDFGQLHPDFHQDEDPATETKPTGQPRQNVIFEAGMAMSKMPERTLFVEIGTLRGFSDVGGMNVVRITPDAATNMERLRKIIQRLRTAGCTVDDSGTDLLPYARRFAALKAHTRGPIS